MNKFHKATTILLHVLFFIMVGVLAFFIVYNAAFALGDQHMFLKSTAIGKFFNTMGFGGNRFYPLGHMDVNSVLLFGTSAAAHFAINIPTFIVLSLAVLALCYHSIPRCTTYNIWTQIAIFCGAALVVCRLYQLFLDIIFPEKMLCTMLAIFLLCGIKFFQTDKWVYGIISLLAAVYATYCKEPLFGALLVFGVVLLLFGYKTLSQRQKIYIYLLIANCIIFISIYLLCIYSTESGTYHINNPYNSKLTLILAMLRSQKMIAVAWLFAFWRAYALIFKQEKDHLLFDAMLFAGCAYFCGMVIMDGCTNYFYMPSMVLVVPAILYFSFLYFKHWGAIIIVGCLALFYAAKVPRLIEDNQATRRKDPAVIQTLVDYQQQGYKLLWYESENNTFLRSYNRTLYNVYVGYLLNEKFELENISSLNEYVEDNYILLCYSYGVTDISKQEVDSLTDTYSLQRILEDEARIPMLIHKAE